MLSRITRATILLLILGVNCSAQSIWKDISIKRSSLHSVEHETLPRSFRLLDLDIQEMDNVLSKRTTDERCLDIPMPDGGDECFQLEAVNIVDAGLQSADQILKLTEQLV